MITPEAVQKVIEETVKAWMEDSDFKSVEEINRGNCYDFAEAIINTLWRQPENLFMVEYDEFSDLLPGGYTGSEFSEARLAELKIKIPEGVTVKQLTDSGLGETGMHAFLHLEREEGDLFFDAECPEGTDSPFKLPFAKRALEAMKLV